MAAAGRAAKNGSASAQANRASRDQRAVDGDDDNKMQLLRMMRIRVCREL